MRTIGIGAVDSGFVTAFDSVGPWVQMAPIWVVTSAASGSGLIIMTARLYLNEVLVETRVGMTNVPSSTGTYFAIGPRSPLEGANNAFSGISFQPQLGELFTTRRMRIDIQVTFNSRTTATTLAVYVQGYRTRDDHQIREFVSMGTTSGSAGPSTNAAWLAQPIRQLFGVAGPGRMFGVATCRVDNQGNNNCTKQGEFYVDGTVRETIAVLGTTYQAAFGMKSSTYVTNAIDTLTQPGNLWSPNIIFETSLTMFAHQTYEGTFLTAILEIFGAAFVGVYAS